MYMDFKKASIILLFIVFGSIMVGMLAFFGLPLESYWRSVSTITDMRFSMKDDRAYFMEQVFPSADASSLVIALNGAGSSTPYAKDKKHVYYIVSKPFEPLRIIIIDGADTDSFELLANEGGVNVDAGSYAKDKKYVYLEATPIFDADPATFRLLYNRYGLSPYHKDKHHVYYVDKVVSTADAATFIVLPEIESCGGNCFYDAKDAAHSFLEGEILMN